MHYFRYLLLLLISSVAYADSAGLGLFSVPASDRSVYYLQQIFGSVGSVIPANDQTNHLLGSIFLSFNTAIFTLGTLIITWIGFSGMLHAAASGKMLGKEGSSLWSPAKVLTGLFILMPTTSGYSFIQVTVMWVVLNSIGAANALWTNLLNYYTYQAPYANLNVDPTHAIFTQFVNMSLCQHAINNGVIDSYVMRTPELQGLLVDVIPKGNQIIMGVTLPGTNTVVPLCGAITVPDISQQADANWPVGLTGDLAVTLYKSALLNTLSTVSPLVDNALQAPDMNQWATDNAPLLQDAALSLNEYVQQQLTNYLSNQAPSTSTTAYEDGWIHAGSYYYVLAKQGGSLNLAFALPSPMTGFSDQVTDPCANQKIADVLAQLKQIYNPQCTPQVTTQLTTFYTNFLSGKGAQLISAISNALQAAKEKQQAAQNRSQGTLGVHTATANFALSSAASSNASGLLIFPSLDNLVSDFSSYLTTKSGDPLASVGSFGMGILHFLDTLWTTSILIAFFIVLAGSSMQCMQPMALALNALSDIIMTIQNFLFGLLFPAGVLLGIYTPMIPYLIFTLASIGWFILVIEAMTAAPLVAVSFLIPHDSEELGHAATAIGMLTGLFIRPALMIVGFAAGTRICQIGIEILNYSFYSTIEMQTGDSTLFGFIAIFLMYVGIVLTIINQSFTLIHHVPDQVMKWIGIHGEQTNTSGMQEMKKSVDSGVKMGKTFNTTASGAVKAGIEGIKGKKPGQGASAGGNL